MKKNKNKYCIMCDLDKSLSKKTTGNNNGKYVIMLDKKPITLYNLSFCFDIRAKDRSKALFKAFKKLKGTKGVISITIDFEYEKRFS